MSEGGTSLGVKRLGDETWRQCVERVAGEFGLAQECLFVFDQECLGGIEDDQAAWAALCEWDCLEVMP